MTRRSSTPPRPTRRRRAVSPTRRVARGQTFTPLGFAFFRLVSLGGDRDPGGRQYAVLRVCEPRRTMAAFVAAARRA